MVVKEQADTDHPARPQLGHMRHHEARRPDQVPGDTQQDLPLGERLVHQLEFVLLEVAQPAVDQLRRSGRRGAGQVPSLDQDRRQSPAGGVARDTGAVDAAADDEQVVSHRGAL